MPLPGSAGQPLERNSMFPRNYQARCNWSAGITGPVKIKVEILGITDITYGERYILIGAQKNPEYIYSIGRKLKYIAGIAGRSKGHETTDSGYIV
jgi:hypothetical protein